MGNSIEREIIDKIILTLSNDIHNAHEESYCYDLIVYKFLVTIYFLAREKDFDNLQKYNIEVTDFPNGMGLSRYEEQIGERIRWLCNIYGEPNDSSKENLGQWFYQERLKQLFVEAIATMIGNVVLIDTKDLSILMFDWIPWKELEKVKSKEEIKENVKAYVEYKAREFSKERQETCMSRIDEILFEKIKTSECS